MNIQQKIVHIHDTFKQIMSNKRFEDAADFASSYCNSDKDPNEIYTLIILIKGMKERTEFKEVYKTLKEELNAKHK